MKYQVGDDVAVDFIGRIIRIEVDIEGKIVYTIRGNAGTYCTVTENCIRPLPLPEAKDVSN